MSASYLSPLSRVDLITVWYPHARKSAFSHAASQGLQDVPDLLEDLTQEGMWALIRSVQKFDVSRGVPFEHYAKTAIKHGILDGLRATQRRRRLEALVSDDVNLDDFLADDEPSPEDHAIAGNHRDLVQAGVAALPDALHSVYFLIYVEGLTQREAARSLHVSQPRVSALNRRLLKFGRGWFGLPASA